MRFAYERGQTYFVEVMEEARESVAAQAAYTLALMRGEHPEVLERAVAER
jgi:predicted RecB family endonuclease